jgi:ribulose-phosphate 3-epimerase
MPRPSLEILIAPSLLAADFAHIGSQIRLVEQGGADWLHLDVMDGSFVPNISFGPPVIAKVRGVTSLPLDAHLMIEEPIRFLEEFKKIGCDRITVHVEACRHLHETVTRIRELGMKPGVTLNPSTPISSLVEILDYVDLVLIMTVNPGFGGQKFIPSMYRKIEEMSAMIEKSKRDIFLQVDGGVSVANAAELATAGATVFVAGVSIFTQPDIPAAVRNLRAAAGRKK